LGKTLAFSRTADDLSGFPFGLGKRAELGHVFKPKKSPDELGVFGRPSDRGKALEIFSLELRPRDEFGDLQPPVPCVSTET
jgi:hypothetical protein